jgi:hypothetical protein
VPVHNVSMPLLMRTNPDRPPFLVVEVPLGDVEVPLGDTEATGAPAEPLSRPLVESA